MTTKRATAASGTLPYWSDSTAFPTFAKLDRDCEVDVVVIGAGVTGLTSAYLLTLAGKSVAVLERGRCAEVDSGHTSAHLTMVTDVPLSKLAADFGETHAQAVWDAGLAAIAQIDEIVHEHEVDCDFNWVDGYLHLPTTDRTSDGVDVLEKEAALATELGFDADFVPDVPSVGGPGVRFTNQARFHPRKYLSALARVLRERGVQIFEHSDAREYVADPVAVQANDHSIRAADIVIATHNPAKGLASTTAADLFQTKLALFTSYVVAGRAPRKSGRDLLGYGAGLSLSPHRTPAGPRRDCLRRRGSQNGAGG